MALRVFMEGEGGGRERRGKENRVDRRGKGRIAGWWGATRKGEVGRGDRRRRRGKQRGELSGGGRQGKKSKAEGRRGSLRGRAREGELEGGERRVKGKGRWKEDTWIASPTSHKKACLPWRALFFSCYLRRERPGSSDRNDPCRSKSSLQQRHGLHGKIPRKPSSR